MSDPFRVEQDFQALKQSLALLSSRRMRLLKTAEFLEPFLNTNDTITLRAYAPEVLPAFAKLLLETDFNGTNIQMIDRLSGLLEKLLAAMIELSMEEVFQKASHHLNAERARIVNSKPSVESAQKQDGVWIPLVEREQILAATKPAFASLRHAECELSFSAKESVKDKIHIQHFVEGDSAAYEKVHDAIEAGKELFRRYSGIEITRKLIVHCSIGSSGVVTGESLNAGVAALVFGELLRLYQHKEMFTVRGDVAITGGVDEGGALRPVDAEGLRLKVEACVFSQISFLVVPLQQLETARRTSQLFGEIRHEPPLEIVGISALREIFYDRRLTDLHHVPIVVQGARKVWKRRRTIAALLLVTALLVIWKLWYGPIDKNPVMGDFEGEMMVMRNKYGEKIKEMKVGAAAVNAAKSDRENGVPRKNYVFYDLDGDGVNEVFWIRDKSGEGTSESEIVCQSLTRDSVLWVRPFTRKLEIPRDPGAAQEKFHSWIIQVGDFDHNGKPELLALGSNGFYPCLLWKLDAATGVELGSYLHIGNFNSLQLADLDGDGIQEIILTGVNNAFRRACLVVLDPRYISGHSPMQGDYFVRGIPPGLERSYLIFPRSAVGEAYKYESKWTTASSVDINNQNRTMTVTIQDVYHTDIGSTQGDLHLTLNFTLEVLSVSTGDGFDLLAERALDEKRISRIPNFDYWEQYRRNVMYWDGDGWQNKSIPNKRWKEVAKR